MNQFEYKAVPTPRRGKRAKGVKGEPARFAHVITETINEFAKDGWEYYKSETLPMEAKNGLFKGRVETFQSLLIFRKAVTDNTDTSESAALPLPPVATQEEPVEPQVTSEPEETTKPAPKENDAETAQSSDKEMEFDENKIDPLSNMVEAHRGEK